MDIGIVIEKFGLPAASAISAWVGRAMTLAKKIETMEKATETMNKQLLADLAECNERCEELERRVALTMTRVEIEKSIRDLRQEVRRMESRFRTTTGEFAKDAELSRFITEESERWQKMAAMVGKIEGILAARRNIP